MDDQRRDADVRPLRNLSHVLDELIPLPGGYRIGLDGLIGLIPGVGDAVGAALSSYIIAQAARLGVPTSVLLRMIGNVALETVVGAIPFLGDLFDFGWKANRRNVALLERHFGQSTRGERGNQRLRNVIVVALALFFIAILALIWGLFKVLAELIAAA